MWAFCFHEEPGIVILIYFQIGYMINIALPLHMSQMLELLKYLSEHLKYNPNRKKSSKNILDTRLAN
jgi:hypothetical protein